MLAKVDENMPIESVDLLNAAGWTCDTVYDEALGGSDDSDIGSRCQTEGRVLFTLDKDFADIRSYPPSRFAGIIVFRPAVPSRDGVLKLLRQVVPLLETEWTEHQLWIVEPGRVRVRSESGPPAGVA